MNKPNFIFKTFLFIFVLSAGCVFGQDRKEPQADPCYEVILQILVASNSASEKSSLPPSLSNVVKKLKINYSYSDYRLSTTFLQRTSNSVEYKSLLSDFTGLKDNNAPVFSEWSLRNLKNLPTAAGRSAIQFDGFRFGMQIPVVSSSREENGKTVPSIIYHSTGISTTRFNMSESEPTIIGSLTTSKPDELMFLILTVKPVD